MTQMKKLTIPNADEYTEQWKFLYTASENAKWCYHCRKQFGIQRPHDPSIPLLDFYPREMKTYTHAKPRVWMTIAALFIIATSWKLKCKWINKL